MNDTPERTLEPLSMRSRIERLERELAIATARLDECNKVKMSFLESLEQAQHERDVANNRLAEIEKAAQIPDFTCTPLKRISINEINGLAKCDENDPLAAFYKRTDVRRYCNQLWDHTLHLAAENQQLREDAERWQHGLKHGFPYKAQPAFTHIEPRWYCNISGLTVSFESANEAIDAARRSANEAV